MTRGTYLVALCSLLALACERQPQFAAAPAHQLHSSALAIDPQHTRLFVAHPDADSVSSVDLRTRRILRERQLGDRPQPDAAGRYEPSVAPRALALDSTGHTLYVTGQRSGRLYVLDADHTQVLRDVFVCSEPIGVLVSADDASVFVACAQDDQVLELAARDLRVIAAVPCPRKPWALAWAADRQTLLATHFLGPGVSAFATQPLSLTASVPLAPGPVHLAGGTAADGVSDPTEPHGEVRGLYDLLVRPGSTELWIAHLMLGIDTPQPELDFERTVFPALSILDVDGTQLARLSVQANPGDGGAFGDVVSGPHALAFSDDGELAFLVDANSEDVLVIDAEQRVQAQLVRPLPGHLPEAIVWADDTIYVSQRNTEDVAVFRVTRAADGVQLEQAGAVIPTLRNDPMPTELRLGQKLFHSANSDDVPLTQNHWVACASCHLEGRSDAVTWRFGQGPRDTPSNAGGMLDTGFLFRTADRVAVQDYWRTIDLEQGGRFSGDEPSQKPLLDALAAYVNQAIPTPIPPSTDLTHRLSGAELEALRARGREVFERVHCTQCHFGPALTDSGAGNPQLDLSGPIADTEAAGAVVLHDVGTCADDVEHVDIEGHARPACAFDTPQLRGLSDSAPYLHDGSATTLADLLPRMLAAGTPQGEPPPVLSKDEETALVEYLRSL